MYPTITPRAARHWMERFELRRRYTTRKNALSRAFDNLTATDNTSERFTLLQEAAGLTEQLAELHEAAWGRDTGPDGRRVSESLAASTALLKQVATTERGALAGTWTALEPIAADEQLQAWSDLARTRDPAGRAVLLRRLQDLCADNFGEAAAAVLGMLADSEDERARAANPLVKLSGIRRWPFTPAALPCLIGITQVFLIGVAGTVPGLAVTDRLLWIAGILAVLALPEMLHDFRSRRRPLWAGRAAARPGL